MNAKSLLMVLSVLVAAAVGAYGVVAVMGDDDTGVEAPKSAPSPVETAGGQPSLPLRSLVPEEPFVYAETSLDPGEAQGEALDELLGKFPALGGVDETVELIRKEFDEGFEEDGLDFNFSADIEPWLGDDIAGYSMAPSFISSEAPAAGVLVETEDEDATRAFLDRVLATQKDVQYEESTYGDLTYQLDESEQTAFALFRGHLIFGTEAGLHRIADAAGDSPSLEESERFATASEHLPSERLGLFYIDFQAFFKTLPGAAFLGTLPENPLSAGLDRGQAIALYARPDALVVEATSPVLEGPLGETATAAANDLGLLPELPGGSWLAASAPNLGPQLQLGLEQLRTNPFPGFNIDQFIGPFERQFKIDIERDFLSWIGDVAFFVQETQPLRVGGGVVIESLKPRTSDGAVVKLEKILKAQGAPVRALTVRGAKGFSIKDRFTPEPFNFAASGDRVAIAYGDPATEDALRPSSKLGDATNFKVAAVSLGEDFTPGVYLDIPPVIELIEASVGSLDEAYTSEVKPNLKPLSHIIMGSKVADGLTSFRLVIGTR